MRLSIVFDWANMLSRSTTVALARFVKASVASLKSNPLMAPFAYPAFCAVRRLRRVCSSKKKVLKLSHVLSMSGLRSHVSHGSWKMPVSYRSSYVQSRIWRGEYGLMSATRAAQSSTRWKRSSISVVGSKGSFMARSFWRMSVVVSLLYLRSRCWMSSRGVRRLKRMMTSFSDAMRDSSTAARIWFRTASLMLLNSMNCRSETLYWRRSWST